MFTRTHREDFSRECRPGDVKNVIARLREQALAGRRDGLDSHTLTYTPLHTRHTATPKVYKDRLCYPQRTFTSPTPVSF